MKRTRHIHHAAFRKIWQPYAVAPLALAISAVVMLSGCEQKDDKVAMYMNADDCSRAESGQQGQCQAAYDHALKEAARTAPKYSSRDDCVAEFGADQCQQAPTTNAETHQAGSMWMPLMAGFMMGRMLNSHPQAQPLFTPRAANSPARGQFVDASGKNYGAAASGRRVSVPPSAFTPKPSTTSTITRGGFGRTVASAAQSSPRSGQMTHSRSSFGG